MKLHCEICALFDPTTGSYRIGSYTEIAEVDFETIDYPFEARMFKPITTIGGQDRGMPVPWQGGAEWNTMKCPRGGHNIFVMSDERAEQAMKDGGPETLLTNEGLVNIKALIKARRHKDLTLNEKADRIFEMRKMRKDGMKVKDIAEHFGISGPRVSQILKGKQNG